MSSTVAAPEVGAKIVEWYSCIISYDREQAILSKHEVNQLMNRMVPDEKVKSYYELVNFRHQLFIEPNASEKKQFAAIAIADKATDEYMQFMYYFMYGQNEFHNGRYKSAVRSYKIAERLLEQVPDQIEKAEFYYRSAISYYRVDQYIFAVSYFEQALEIFEKKPDHEEIVLNIHIFLGGISTELHKFEEAEDLLQHAFRRSKPYPVTRALLLRILGLNRVKQNRQDEAIQYFEEALLIKEHRDSVVGAKTEYNLINVKLRKEPNKKENHDILNTISHKVQSLHMTEYVIRCKVSLGLYVLNDTEMINEGLEALQQAELYFEASELAEEVVDVYSKLGEFEKALHFMRMAHRMRIHQSCIGVEQT
ncbi:tetratricopeptide repeat protein [Bacillus sp. C1-1]|nr:tetratricopeptide repeat protein [Bacillus sp. C1-1]